MKRRPKIKGSIYGNNRLSLLMRKLQKPIEVRLMKDAEEYVLSQSAKVQERLLTIFDKTALV